MVPLMPVGSCHKSTSKLLSKTRVAPSAVCVISTLHGDRGLTTPFLGWVGLHDLGGCLSVGIRAQSEAWFLLDRLVDYAANLLRVSHDTSQQRSREGRQSLARPFGILSVGSSTKAR